MVFADGNAGVANVADGVVAENAAPKGRGGGGGSGKLEGGLGYPWVLGSEAATAPALWSFPSPDTFTPTGTAPPTVIADGEDNIVPSIAAATAATLVLLLADMDLRRVMRWVEVGPRSLFVVRESWVQ